MGIEDHQEPAVRVKVTLTVDDVLFLRRQELRGKQSRMKRFAGWLIVWGFLALAALFTFSLENKDPNKIWFFNGWLALVVMWSTLQC